MKILYIARERIDAQSAATALRDVAPNVEVLWASRFDQAVAWIDEHRNLAALLVDAQVDDQGCAPFLTHVRRQGINAPAVVIAPEESCAPIESLHAGADDYAAKNQSLPRALPAALTRASARAHTLGAGRWDHLRTDTPPFTPTHSSDPQSHQQERAMRGNLERELAQARAALQDAEHRRQSITSAAGQLAERLAQYDIRIARADAMVEMVDEQFRNAATEVERARRSEAAAAADVERLTRREADLSLLLSQANASCSTLASRLADLETAFDAAAEQAARERLTVAERASQREAEFEGLLNRELATRRDVEETLGGTETALRDAQERHARELGAITAELADYRSRFQVELSQSAAACDRLEQQLRDAEDAIEAARDRHASTAAAVARLTEREAELASQLVDEASGRSALELQLTAARLATQDTIDRAMRERLAAASSAADREANLDARIQQECAKRVGVEQQLASVESAQRDAELALDELRRQHSSAVAEIERLTQREAGLACQLTEAEAARTTLDLRLADAARAIEDADTRATQERLQAAARQATLESRLAQETASREALEREMAETRTAAEAALDRVSSEHAAALARQQGQLDQSRAVMLRQFEESPLAMCRCTRDGTLTHANRAFALLIGHGSVDELRNTEFGEVVFESANDLPWLIERSVNSAATASIETTWRTKEGVLLTVRVSASALDADAIEIVAEDFTNLRALQESLGRAQRMEAVGRLASEVAVTCANLLSDVHQDAQKWLRTVGTDTSLRHRGEMLLDEVTRAGGFLRQLAAYGDEQTSALSPVDLNKVLRDLGPVLKRVAGDDVALELPRTMAPITVDVQCDRVERLLVNLAGYGRERMPFGGRLKIELATVTVDQEFIERHPNVRRGPHALITATEIRRTTRAEGQLRLREWPAQTTSDPGSTGKPGVDLGALQGLIRECGGHLWVTAVPHGDMVVQIHLPLRSSDEQKPPRHPARRAGQTLTGSSMVRH